MRPTADKKRLAALLIGILALGFLSTSLLSYLVSSSSVRSSIIDQQLPLTSDNVYSEIQRDLLRPIGVSQQMAQDTFLRDWVLSGEKDPQSLIRYLAEIKTHFDANTSFFISENTRKYYYADGVLKTVSESDPNDTWYFRARAMKERYEVSVDTDKAHRNTLTAFINYRVLDYQGRHLGVTGVGITLGSMRSLIASYESKYQRRVFFVDEGGQIVLAGAAIGSQIQSLQDMPGLSELASQVINASKEPARLSYRRDGAAVQVNSRFVPELKWYLVVEESEAASVGPLRQMLGWNLLVSTLATALVLVVTLYTVNRYQRRLEHMASTDELSGLANREMGGILFEQALLDAARFKHPLCLVLMDVDHFKRINDQRGHLAGDAVIKALGALLRQSLRRNDVVVRWGGEEFLVLMAACPTQEALHWAEKARSAIAAHDFGLGDTHGPVTASLGLAAWRPGDTRDSLFSRADAALYLAKSKGRNRVEQEAAV